MTIGWDASPRVNQADPFVQRNYPSWLHSPAARRALQGRAGDSQAASPAASGRPADSYDQLLERVTEGSYLERTPSMEPSTWRLSARYSVGDIVEFLPDAKTVYVKSYSRVRDSTWRPRATSSASRSILRLL